jgi:hypothetical protein
LFLNTRGPRFADVSAATGGLDDDARSVAVADWDHDGDLDLWLANRTSPRVRFLRNDVPSENAHLTLELIGDPKRGTNRDAVGAQVEVHFGGRQPRKLLKSVVAGDGFLSQSSKLLHFGLGDAKTAGGAMVERVVVRWPSVGKTNVETFANLDVNGRYRIVQGTGRAEAFATAPRNIALEPAALRAAPQTSVGGSSCSNRCRSVCSSTSI